MLVTFMKCPHCSYEWVSRSSLPKVTCPKCFRKVDKQLGVQKDIV